MDAGKHGHGSTRNEQERSAALSKKSLQEQQPMSCQSHPPIGMGSPGKLQLVSSTDEQKRVNYWAASETD